ncbi:cystathionine gamma-synthase [Streptococcus rifensis]
MREQFPLIDDDELMVREQPVMNLYDDKDLISNIKGPYDEPSFTSEQESSFSYRESILTPKDHSRPGYERARVSSAVAHRSMRTSQPQSSEKQRESAFSYTQVARAQAREDLKRKRSASYLNFDKPGFKSKELPQPKPTRRDLDKEQMDDLARSANRLRQSSYILAELKPDVLEVNEEEAPKSPKNNYDFLKTSQVYNYQGNSQKKNKKVAQELDLTRFE